MDNIQTYLDYTASGTGVRTMPPRDAVVDTARLLTLCVAVETCMHKGMKGEILEMEHERTAKPGVCFSCAMDRSHLDTKAGDPAPPSCLPLPQNVGLRDSFLQRVDQVHSTHAAPQRARRQRALVSGDEVAHRRQWRC